MSEVQNPNDRTPRFIARLRFEKIGILSFEFVSDFEIRNLDFPTFYPFTFPIGVNRTTGLLIPANSVASITSSMSL